jgi:hypothetical protein
MTTSAAGLTGPGPQKFSLEVDGRRHAIVIETV